MECIISKSQTFQALFGEQDVFDKQLNLASYCLSLPCEDGLLLYNSLSRELVLLNKEEEKCLEQINVNTSNIAKYLKKGWFYIPENQDGKSYCDQMRNMAKALQKPKHENYYSSFTIMTTLECNARCFYCFQKGKVQPRMSAKTAEDVAEFILTNSNPEKRITICWFGGEPLYNSEVVDIISERLKKSGRAFVSKMVSNGYLANEEIIKKAKDLWNLKKVQITLDGTENIYNHSKNYIYEDVESPFKTVIANIETLLKNDITVSIRLNLGGHNFKDLYLLVDFLTERFSSYKKFSIYAHRLFDYDEFGNQLHKDADIVETITMFSQFNSYLVEKEQALTKILSKDYIVNYCMADSDSSVVITPDGKLSKCEHFSDREIIGDIYSSVKDKQLLSDWKQLQPAEKICEDCAAYMNCYRIKKCPDISPKCSVYEKEEQLHELKLKILNTYKKWKKHQEEKIITQ